MILEALMELVLRVLVLAFNPISIMALPDQVSDVITTLCSCIGDGLMIIASYTHITYLLALFAIVAVVDFAIHGYHAIMWILKKFPFINIH